MNNPANDLKFLLYFCFTHVNRATNYAIGPVRAAFLIFINSLNRSYLFAIACKTALVGRYLHNPFGKNSSIHFHKAQGKHN